MVVKEEKTRMTSLFTRSAILTVSRLSDFAIQLLGPLLLVRILDVADYGMYQEFLIYATLISTLCAFSIDSSLTYFIPRFPGREREFVTQASLLILGISAIIIAVLFIIRPITLGLTSYDFVLPLAAYVLFFVNLNWLEYYWIAKRQTVYVLAYSAIRLFLRVSVLLVVAYTTRDVVATIWSMVVVEGFRVLVAFVFFAKKAMFRVHLRWQEIKEQLKFAAPIGTAAVIQRLGRDVGKICASIMFGPTTLAYYAVGSYLQPIIRVIRSGVQDAVYPELVRANNELGGALQLWRRVTVLNCVVFFPTFVLVIFYAEEAITVLFTSEYLAAVPLFNIYAFLLIRRCFNADALLRSTGQTGFMIWGAFGGLALNVALILVFSKLVGIIGPAIALVISEIGLEVYYAQRVRYALKLTIADLVDWRSIFRIAFCCGLAAPILFCSRLLPGSELIRIAAASSAYLLVVFLLAYRLGVDDIGRIAYHLWSTIRRVPGR